MIGYLRGIPKLDGTHLLVDVHGVGYLVYVGTSCLSAASQMEEIELYIHTHVREQSLELFGFQTAAARDLFLLLIDVSGVGPKTALAIADTGSDKIVEAVQNANVSFFTKVPRVGKKLAQKIIIELKSKLGSLKELNIATLSPELQIVVDAVTALGFSEEDAQQAVQELDLAELDTAAAVKAVLKQLQ